MECVQVLCTQYKEKSKRKEIVLEGLKHHYEAIVNLNSFLNNIHIHSSIFGISFTPLSPVYVSLLYLRYIFHSSISGISFTPLSPVYLSLLYLRYIFHSSISGILFTPLSPVYLSLLYLRYIFHSSISGMLLTLYSLIFFAFRLF